MTLRHPPIMPGCDHLLHGGDYNPDQWLGRPDVINDDFRLFPLAGCSTFTIGVFAWARLEPVEDRYDFGWLDRIMDHMADAGHRVILATPSGARPAWLGLGYPDTCRVDATGHREPWRSRHNHCPTSPVLRRKVVEIDARLAERYGRHPALGLWHLGNEFNGECYCERCRSGFSDWLHRRYGDLARLNDAWWTAFWSHTLPDWNAASLGDESIDGMRLDWLRYTSDQTAAFIRLERDAVQPHSPGIAVTTNFMGAYPGLDYQRLAAAIDVVSNDSYPSLDLGHGLVDGIAEACFNDDVMRGLRPGRPWLQMECTPSVVNWKAGRLKRPGVHRLEVFRSIADGADGCLYFQWRKGAGGCEKHHGAVVDHVGHDRSRVFQEVAAAGRMLTALRPARGLPINAMVAVIHDWESRWAWAASQGPVQGRDPKRGARYERHVRAWHRALRRCGVVVDIVGPRTDLSPYRLVVAPGLHLVDSGVADRLAHAAAQGATVVATTLTGYVDASNRCHLGGWPGAGLRQLFGVWVEEPDELMPGDALRALPVPAAPLSLPGPIPASELAERIHVEDAAVCAIWDGQFYAGMPAVTWRQHGRGVAIWCAGRGEALETALAEAVVTASGAVRVVPRPPAEVWASERGAGCERVLFLFNAGEHEADVVLPGGAWKDLEDASVHTRMLRLDTLACLALRPLEEV